MTNKILLFNRAIILYITIYYFIIFYLFGIHWVFLWHTKYAQASTRGSEHLTYLLEQAWKWMNSQHCLKTLKKTFWSHTKFTACSNTLLFLLASSMHTKHNTKQNQLCPMWKYFIKQCIGPSTAEKLHLLGWQMHYWTKKWITPTCISYFCSPMLDGVWERL